MFFPLGNQLLDFCANTKIQADITGGPQSFVASKPQADPDKQDRFDLTQAHCRFKITPAEFDAVATELKQTMDHFRVGAREQKEVLAAFSAHKAQVTACAAHDADEVGEL